MKNFIETTIKTTGKRMLVNINQIKTVNEDLGKEGQTVIVIGDHEELGHEIVKESYDEIVYKIKKAQSSSNPFI